LRKFALLSCPFVPALLFPVKFSRLSAVPRLLPALRWLTLWGVAVLFSSCAALQRAQVVLKSKADDAYRADKGWKQAIYIHPGDTAHKHTVYRVSPYDVLGIRLANLPKELEEASDIPVPTAQGAGGSLASGASRVFGAFPPYQVDAQGNIVLPLLHRVNVLGLTTLQVRDSLEAAYSRFYRNPLVEVQAQRLRFYAFGELGRTGLIEMPTERTHLVEALSLAGGVPYTGKLNRIKIIRGNWQDPKVIWVNLRMAQALKHPDLYMQNQDIVYVEPRNAQLFLREVTPYTTILNIATLVPTLFLLFSQFFR
jgi:polysaccharide export outer membrane protein